LLCVLNWRLNEAVVWQAVLVRKFRLVTVVNNGGSKEGFGESTSVP
jgi:hypothetical protein